MEFYVVNIGNTFTEYGGVTNNKIGEIKKVLTKELELDIFGNIPLAIATVVKEVKEKFVNRDVFYVNHENCMNFLDYSLVKNPETIGMDRIANVANLVRLKEESAIVIDFGTAITFEGVSQRNCFKGGVIIPGRALQRKALFLGTSQLPEIQMNSYLRESLGVDTATSIEFGIDNSLVAGVDHILNKFIKEMKFVNPKVYATGGDRKLFLDNIANLIDGGNIFTLEGIKFAYEMSK